MNKPDIRPDHFKIVQDILNQHLASDVKVWVYGSRAKWTTLDSSDLDLALEGKGPVAYNVMSRLNIDFKNSDLPYEVDLRDMATVQPFFKNIINKDKILLDRFSPLKDAFIDITSLQKILILKLLKKYIPEWEVWVYGSRVKWSAKPSSDLDMVLFAKDEDQNKDQSKVDELRQAFKDSDLPFCVDLFVWSQIPERFHQEIKKDHVVLQRKAGNSRALPKGWKEVRLGDVASDVSYGYTASAKNKKVGPKFLRITDIVPEQISWDNVPYCEITINQFKKYKLEIGDIVIARTGATTGYNKVIKTNVDTVFASYLIRYKITLSIADPFYIGYVLKSNLWKNFVLKTISGSAQPGINAKQFSSFKLPLPPVKEQRAIARILSSLDDKIELNRQINKTLERMAQAIFKSWFVDFDPVYAKKFALEAGRSQQQAEQAAMAVIAGVCTPKESATQFKEMNAKLDEKLAKMSKGQVKHLTNTASLFPSDVKDSPLGPLPTSWSCKSIKEIANVVCGKTPSKKIKTYFSGKIPFIKIPDMYNKTFVFNTEDSLTEEGKISQDAKTIPPKSICVSCIATVGLVSMNATESQTNQQINSIIPKKVQYIYFIYLFMKSPYTFTLLRTMASGGTATMNLNTKDFSNITVKMVSEDLISEFHDFITPFFEKIFINQLQIQNLEKIRDTLLPKLLSGDINTSHISIKEFL